MLKEQTDRLKWVQGESTQETPKQEAPKNSVPTATPEQAFEPTNNKPKDELPF